MKFRVLSFILVAALGCRSEGSDNTLSSHPADGATREIQLDTSLIKPFFRSDRLTPENPELSFSRVAHFGVDLDNNGKLDSIDLYNLDNKGGGPGDFNQIKIRMDNGKIWEETNFDGWVRFNENFTVPREVQDQNQLKTDLILLTDFGQTKLLGLFTWVYASEPGLLTFIEFSSGRPRIMFNKESDLLSIATDSIVTQYFSTRCVIRLDDRKLTRSSRIVVVSN